MRSIILYTVAQQKEGLIRGSLASEHYQAFAHALPHHAALISSLTKAQEELKEARSNLVEAKMALGNRRVDLVQLWSRGQTLEEMMKLLDEMLVLRGLKLSSTSEFVLLARKSKVFRTYWSRSYQRRSCFKRPCFLSRV